MPYQLKEGWQKAEGQSDPSIVLRDGRTDHMGKGRAGGLREQKTNTAGRNVPEKTVRRTLFELNKGKSGPGPKVPVIVSRDQSDDALRVLPRTQQESRRRCGWNDR